MRTACPSCGYVKPTQSPRQPIPPAAEDRTPGRVLDPHGPASITTDPYSWGGESVARSIAEGLGFVDATEVQ